MSRKQNSISPTELSPYWQTVKEYVETLDPRSAMAFIKSHSVQDIQALAKALLGDKVPKKTLADILDNIAGYGGTVGFTALPTLATLAFALPLHGLHVPTMQFDYTDYSIYDALCAINVAAMGAHIKELDTAQTKLIKQIRDIKSETDSTEPLELQKLQEKKAVLTAQKRFFWGMLTTITAGITAYIITSPDTHILTNALSATALANVSGVAGIALSLIFVGIMSILAVIEAKQAAGAKNRVAILETQLKTAITHYEAKTVAAEKVNALTNLLYFQKAQAATHQTNSLLFAGTATTLLGSTVAMTTFMIMALVGASVAGGAVTMGAVPLAFGLACAAIALYRWYRNTYPAEVKPVKNAGEEPITMGELEQENKRSSNWAGLFNKKPAISATPSQADSHAKKMESTQSIRLRHHYSPSPIR